MKSMELKVHTNTPLDDVNKRESLTPTIASSESNITATPTTRSSCLPFLTNPITSLLSSGNSFSGAIGGLGAPPLITSFRLGTNRWGSTICSLCYSNHIPGVGLVGEETTAELVEMEELGPRRSFFTPVKEATVVYDAEKAEGEVEDTQQQQTTTTLRKRKKAGITNIETSRSRTRSRSGSKTKTHHQAEGLDRARDKTKEGHKQGKTHRREESIDFWRGFWT